MTAKEAAQCIGKSEATIRRWIKEGKLDAAMVGGKYNIQESAIKAHVKSQDHTESAHGNGESAEIEPLLTQNAELSEQVSQQRQAIENQKALIEDLESRLIEEREHVEGTSESPEEIARQHLAIGTFSRKYKDGEIIFEEGSSGKEMYFVVHGDVEVSQHVNDQKMIVAILESGSFFGEMAPLTGYNRTMTIIAKGDVYLWRMTPDEMMRYMRLSPQFTVHMCMKMAQRLGYANLLLRHLTLKTLPTGSDEDVEGETLRYLYRKLTERTEEMKHIRGELQKKDRELKELHGRLRTLKPSLFLRGLDRSRQEEPKIKPSIGSFAEDGASQREGENAILKPNYVSWKQRRSMPKASETR